MDKVNNIVDFGRIPPQAIDMEEAILGAVMIESRMIDDLQELLTPESFYKEEHIKIYSAILELWRDNKAVDILTVTEQLKKTKELEDVGGRLYIAQLTGKVSSAANITEHAQIVKQKFLQRQLITYASDLNKTAFDDSLDVADIIDSANSGLNNITESAYGKGGILSFEDCLAESLSELETREAAAKEGKISGIPTPLKDLDKKLYGWQRSNLIVVAGRPGMGKTAFVLAVAKTAAKADKAVVIFSLEMSEIRLTDRILVGEADVNYERYQSGFINKEEKQAIIDAGDRLRKLKINIDPTAAASMDYIKARCRILQRKGLCDMVILDYLQLATITGLEKRNREQEVSGMSARTKALAKDLNIPVMDVSQLNRSCELRGGDKRPQLSDLRESGAIEQDADIVLMFYRAEKYAENDKSFDSFEGGMSTKGIGEISIAKNREGATGKIKFRYNESLTRIYDYMEVFEPLHPKNDDVIDAMDENLPF